MRYLAIQKVFTFKSLGPDLTIGYVNPHNVLKQIDQLKTSNIGEMHYTEWVRGEDGYVYKLQNKDWFKFKFTWPAFLYNRNFCF